MLRIITIVTFVELLAVAAVAQTTCDDITPGQCADPDICCIIPLCDCPFIPGNTNGKHGLNALDVTYLSAYLKGGPPPVPYPSVADVNGDCAINGQDVLIMVNYFKGEQGAPFKCVIYICPVF